MLKSFYYLAPVLPAFLIICSPTYLIPLPLYGSGFFFALTLAANSPTNCLSKPEICKTFFCLSSNSAFNQVGTFISTL
jgi:hypothetical protein